MRSSESGNALIYILIGVTLFAALGFAISASNRGNNTALSAERASLAASEIIEFGSTVATATGQIRLRGFAENAISFKNDFVAGYDNGNCTTDICQIFHIDGGAVIYKTPPSDWLEAGQSGNPGYANWLISGNNAVEQIGETATADLVLLLPYIKKDICLAINDRLGITNPLNDPPQDSDGIASLITLFTGTYTNSATITLPDPDKGKRAGCFEPDNTSPAGPFHYYQVLLAR